MNKFIVAVISIVFLISFQGCRQSFGNHFILSKSLALNYATSTHEANEDSVCVDIELIKYTDSLFVYDCNLLNKSEQEQWVILFEYPFLEVEIKLGNETQNKRYYNGVIKRGAFLNFKNKYALSIPVIIPTNIPIEILLKIKSNYHKTHTERPVFLPMDKFLFDLKISGLIDNFLLGMLMFLVVTGFYFLFVFKEKVFLFIALNLFFTAVQCANINLVFNSFDNASIVYVFLTASSFYFVFITQIVLYRIIIAPFYCFPVLNILMKIFYVILLFLLGFQVALTFISPEMVSQYMVYSYFPFLVILLLICIFLIVKTDIRVPAYSGILIGVGAFATMTEVFSGFYRYIPLEFCALLAGALLIVDRLKYTIGKTKAIDKQLGEIDNYEEHKIERGISDENFKPRNLLENIGSEVVILRFQDIAYLKIENKLCCIYTFEKGIIISTRSLEFYEKHFKCVFFRLNRQFLASPEGIQRIEVSQDYQYIVTLKCLDSSELIKLTKSKTSLFKDWLTKMYT